MGQKRKKYWVMLARPVIQTTIVQVLAESYEDAEIKAKKKAAELSESEWDGEFDEEDYGVDVVACLPHSDIEAGEDPIEVLYPIGTDYRYLLLKASMNFGDGTLLVEPWLGTCNRIAIADYLGDWNEAIDELYEESVSDMYDWLNRLYEERSAKKSANSAPAKVIFLAPYLDKRRSDKNNDED